MDDLGKLWGTSSILSRALYIVSKPWVNFNWSYTPEMLNSGQNRRFFLSCVTLKFYRWPWKTLGHLFYTTSILFQHKPHKTWYCKSVFYWGTPDLDQYLGVNFNAAMFDFGLIHNHDTHIAAEAANLPREPVLRPHTEPHAGATDLQVFACPSPPTPVTRGGTVGHVSLYWHCQANSAEIGPGHGTRIHCRTAGFAGGPWLQKSVSWLHWLTPWSCWSGGGWIPQSNQHLGWTKLITSWIFAWS